ncbi:hypothetical protein IWW36_001133 [Coemansia brasiliensis]|uniref:Uncharacterized protein n=1 Tax=Coemansia brasiliensis TaxID=2650707 RepID=A0A9W8LZB0_9FUNG|nr:hypothetical protein IWW36_001133 [Coemansia brasiliensis]
MPGAALLSTVKEQALRRMLRRRLIWITIEVVLLLALLALLILHSFRLRNKNDNAYARWTSSWVMILLSVLLVVMALAVFVTFYHFRTRLTWIRDPGTSDSAVLHPQAHGETESGWARLKRLCGGSRGNESRVQVHQPAQQPWLSAEGRNSRAWREMQARQRESSLSSPSSPSISPRQMHFASSTPRRPPRASYRHRDSDSFL